MNKKIRSTLGLLGLLLLILIAGGIYIFVFQQGTISEKEEKLEELNANVYDPEELRIRYENLLKRSAILDSILSARKFNIPQNLSSIKFYNFVNRILSGFSEDTQVNVEFTEQKRDKEFFVFEYKLTGG